MENTLYNLTMTELLFHLLHTLNNVFLRNFTVLFCCSRIVFQMQIYIKSVRFYTNRAKKNVFF